MNRRTLLASAVLVYGPGSAPAAAQAPVVPVASPRSQTDDQPCRGCVTVPALTPVKLELLMALGSKISKTGDVFPIRLAEPIVINGAIAIPAGTSGAGEVIHAKKSGGGGVGGELVLAARYLDVDGQKLRLRSMNLGLSGRTKTDTVNSIAIAGAASPVPIGLLGLFITGGQVTVAAGTIADAKTAEDFRRVPGGAQGRDQQWGGTTNE